MAFNYEEWRKIGEMEDEETQKYMQGKLKRK